MNINSEDVKDLLKENMPLKVSNTYVSQIFTDYSKLLDRISLGIKNGHVFDYVGVDPLHSRPTLYIKDPKFDWSKAIEDFGTN